MIRKVFYVWFSFTGRINRAEYVLYYIIPVIILFAILWIVALSFGTPGPGEEPGSVRYELSLEDNIVATLVFFILFFVLFVGVTWGYVATGVKRLHDLGRSGWTVLAILVPFLGLVV